jgi:hypothetical protein
MRFFAVVIALVSLAGCASSVGARPAARLDGYGISLTLPRGWHGLAAPGQLQAADFPLPRSVLGSAERARVPRGHVHLIVWDYGPSVPYLVANFPPARAPLTLRRRELSSAPVEGFAASDAYAVRSVAIGGELVEVVADLGPKPLAATSLTRVNRLLATLRCSPRASCTPTRADSPPTAWRSDCCLAGRDESRYPPTSTRHSLLCVPAGAASGSCCSS